MYLVNTQCFDKDQTVCLKYSLTGEKQSSVSLNMLAVQFEKCGNFFRFIVWKSYVKGT